MYTKFDLGTQWPYDNALSSFMNRDERTKRSPLTSLVLALINNHQSRSTTSNPPSPSNNLKSVQYLSQRELNQVAKFMEKIETSYQQVPYHNLYHAVDVLAACEVL